MQRNYVRAFADVLSYSQHMNIEDVVHLSENAFCRPMRREHITSTYVDGLADPDVGKFLRFPKDHRPSFDNVAEYVEMNFKSPTDILFGIYVDDRFIGTTRLHDVVPGEIGTVGIAILDKTMWGKGWATKVIQGIVDFAREKFKVRRLQAGIDEGNIGSQRAFEKNGFQRGEGIMWVRPV